VRLVLIKNDSYAVGVDFLRALKAADPILFELCGLLGGPGFLTMLKSAKASWPEPMVTPNFDEKSHLG
jgi:hypothetical protein